MIALVLPARDPAHIPMWRTVAICFLTYSGLCWAYLRVGPRLALLRWSVLGLSLVAIALGGYGIANMIQVANAGGHFEGYIVLMGLILGGHGACAFVYPVLTGRIARQVRAA